MPNSRWSPRAFGALVLLCSLPAQTTQQAAVPVAVQVVSSPPSFTFSWPLDTAANSFTVVHRVTGTTNWGASTTIPGGGTATGWTDTNVTPGVRYDYWFTRNANFGQARTFLNCGIEVPLVETRGKLLLVVDSSMALPLAGELERLTADLVGDGWSVQRLNVLRTQSVASVKARIVAAYNADPSNVKAVFLFGHVPVPYSGAINPDGHPDHYGAWAADVYYGDINGVWTDSTVNTTVASRAANRNIPGDGKFDQSSTPSDVDLMVGRVDLYDMPAFASSETELLRAYLGKDHDYRHKRFAVDQRAVIDDNFGWFGGEAFASSGWRSFYALLGPANVAAADYFTTLNTTSGGGYVWSYGCGGGWYQGAGGVGNTTDFAGSSNRNVFTMLFGSYFGDFDVTDSFLRAPLCQGWTLTNCWAGRPHWTMHHMGLGEPIGYSARYSQNDFFAGGFGTHWVHIALMGDPTLRQHVVAPPSALTATTAGAQVALSWTASADPVAGYHVYRAVFPEGPYTRLTTTAVAGTTYTDTAPLAGYAAYMVRAARLEQAATGSYWNQSQGIFARTCLPGAAVAQSVGTPCGTPAPTFTSTPPVLGQVLNMNIGNGAPNGFGQMFAGTIGSPLPIEGCDLQLSLVSLSLFLPLALDATGNWAVAYPLPNDQSFNCVAIDLQAAVWGTAGLTMSNAMRLVLGN